MGDDGRLGDAGLQQTFHDALKRAADAFAELGIALAVGRSRVHTAAKPFRELVVLLQLLRRVAFELAEVVLDELPHDDGLRVREQDLAGLRAPLQGAREHDRRVRVDAVVLEVTQFVLALQAEAQVLVPDIAALFVGRRHAVPDEMQRISLHGVPPRAMYRPCFRAFCYPLRSMHCPAHNS